MQAQHKKPCLTGRERCTLLLQLGIAVHSTAIDAISAICTMAHMPSVAERLDPAPFFGLRGQPRHVVIPASQGRGEQLWLCGFCESPANKTC